jgi:hypothetical protein
MINAHLHALMESSCGGSIRAMDMFERLLSDAQNESPWAWDWIRDILEHMQFETPGSTVLLRLSIPSEFRLAEIDS